MPQTTIYAAPTPSGPPETPPAVVTVELARLFGRSAALAGVSLSIEAGRLISLTGPNGAGKTTLLRMLIGELAPDSGSVRISKHLRRAYFDQQRSRLDPEESLQHTLCEGGGDQVFVGGRPRHVRGYLKDFLFDPAQAGAPVKSLSGGERNRLMLAKILATPNDLLVLDEPTNDLDMDTLDLLEDILSDYNGTLLLVSHDRTFLDRVVTSSIAMEGDGRAIEYPGGYLDYLRQRKDVPAQQRATGRQRPAQTKERPGRVRERTKLSYKEERELEGLPQAIAALEAEIAALEKALAQPDLFQREPERFRASAARLEEAKSERSADEDRWLELEALREQLAARAS